MNSEPFLRPRLTGPRFDEHEIPLEFFRDLAALGEMIVEVAKWKFLQDHPDRQRVPRGFTEGIELKLQNVEDGSAIPIITLWISSMVIVPPVNQTCYENARDAIISAIGAAQQKQNIIDFLPEKHLGYFDRIGRSLRDGEAIEFPNGDQKSPIRLTKTTRKRLVYASNTINELTEEVSIRGTIPEVDQDNMTFQIQMYDGRKIKASIPTQHLDTILKAFNEYEAGTGTRVSIYGIGRISRQERLLGFESIEHISPLDSLDVPARLDELRILKNGWLDGLGIAPSHEGLNWLSCSFEQHFPDEIPLPFVYPTAEGNIQFEWSIKPNELSLEIDLHKHAAEWHSLNVTTNETVDKVLDLNTSQDWEWIANTIRQVAGGLA